MPDTTDQPLPITAPPPRTPPAIILADHIRARYPAHARPGSLTSLVLQDIGSFTRLEGRATPDALLEAYHEALNLAVSLTEYLDIEGFPPTAKNSSSDVVSWDSQRARAGAVPPKVFRLHELLREHIVGCFLLRECLDARQDPMAGGAR